MKQKRQKHSNAILQDAQKTESTVQLQPSFSLKRKCSELTIGEYIQLVCDNKLDVLVLLGNPDNATLLEAKMAILIEYSELSAGTNLSGSMSHFLAIQRYAADYLQIRIASALIGFEWDKAVDLLRGIGAVTSKIDKNNPERTAKYIQALAALKATQYEKAIADYNKLAGSNEKGKKITERDIRKEMVIVGGDGIISDACNLATYAAKVSVYRERQKAIEDAQRRTIPQK